MKFPSLLCCLVLATAVGADVKISSAAANPRIKVARATSDFRVLLVPLDSRPAAGQFAQMIGKIDGVEVETPPIETLGRFTTPGNPDKIWSWLMQSDLTNVKAVIVSAEMLAHGGLIASRESDISAEEATARLRRLTEFRDKAPKDIKIFVFSATMRLAPTATAKNVSWRSNLAKYEELQDRFERTGERSLIQQIAGLRNKVPAIEIINYEKTRRRNHHVQVQLLQQAIGSSIDFLLMGQDDAKPDGPHIQENEVLRKLASTYRLGEKVYFCEGIDQHANLLLSRVVLSAMNYTPRVKVVFSDPEGPEQYAMYESKTIRDSLKDQLVASGAELARDNRFDYTLFVNTPKRREGFLSLFVDKLKSELDQGLPVAVADINFGPEGASDEQIYNAIADKKRSSGLLSFAGWNTAGNTLGTAIPAANVYLAARKAEVDPLVREVAQREFLFHRIVNDWVYHRYTRVSTYRLIESLQRQKDEVYGINFRTANTFASNNLGKYAREIFASLFENTFFFAGNKQYRLSSLDGLKVSLPWPRAYEARIDFRFESEEVTTGDATNQRGGRKQ